MHVFLMFPDRDFERDKPLPWNAEALIQDLELNRLFAAMADDDAYLFDVARKAVLQGPENDGHTIGFRQAVFADCLKHEAVVRELYRVAVTTIEQEKSNYLGTVGRYPGWILYRSRKVLAMLVGALRQLRRIADQQHEAFASAGFRVLFATIRRELDDDYFARLERHLSLLQFRNGVLLSAQLGRGNKGVGYSLRRPKSDRRNLVKRLLGPSPPSFHFSLHPRDEAGARTLSALRERGIMPVANALAQSVDHVMSFFLSLRCELGFYLGCTNLHARLQAIGLPACSPVAAPADRSELRFTALYDACLALQLEREIAANDLVADGKALIVITGANQGGKSTFLRSIGIAQSMMMAGMFVAAEDFRASRCDALLTHYKREEDATMESGKFDEELARMSEIADHMTAHPLLLLNESFAATNEQEGSEIARQITRALLEKGKRTLFVTHLNDYAASLFEQREPRVLFLRAERLGDGQRTFRIAPAAPLETSYGDDLFDRVFGGAEQTAATADQHAAPCDSVPRKAVAAAEGR